MTRAKFQAFVSRDAQIESFSFVQDFMRELSAAVREIEHDKSCRGIVIASACPSVFSAGLDLNEMYDPEEQRLREFWASFQVSSTHVT